jgi:hypothetical protein
MLISNKKNEILVHAPIRKWKKDINRYFSIENENGSPTCEKMPNTIIHQKNANPKNSEVLSHSMVYLV